MKRQQFYIGTIVLLTVVLLFSFFTKEEAGSLRVEAFGADGSDQQDDSSAIQAAIDYSYENDKLPVQLLGKNYTLKQGLHLKEGVALEMGLATKLLAEGDFNVVELEKKAAITNGTIEITTPEFSRAAIYVSGQEQVWTTERFHIENVVLYNSSGTNRGKGISFTAGNSGEFISFVNVMSVNISGFHTGVHLQAAPPKKDGDYNFINGNRFVNLTLDDCIVCIQFDSAVTIPHEVSGNMFENVQIQLTERTDKAMILSGTNNRIDGMIWDASFVEDNQPLIEFIGESSGNDVNMNVPKDRVTDEGQGNRYSTLEE
ncbi:hypothetical protein [Halobacillus sp. Marseille-Q1614]|uniref:hypothetical protein n=1 Tax=Halobacillus sp. Marseille-Q1614 TaxID=2709134 RepID=UPI00156D9129|nr:hypothetical protein [Halobacillus sp. Marseille-Q1614]